MSRAPGKMGVLLVICFVGTSWDASAGWGRRAGGTQWPTQGQPANVLGQVIKVAPRVPGVPGIPGMSIPGMPHIPGVPGLPGVGSLPGLIGKLR